MKIAYWNLINSKSCLKYEWYIMWLWLHKGSFVFKCFNVSLFKIRLRIDDGEM